MEEWGQAIRQFIFGNWNFFFIHFVWQIFCIEIFSYPDCFPKSKDIYNTKNKTFYWFKYFPISDPIFLNAMSFNFIWTLNPKLCYHNCAFTISSKLLFLFEQLVSNVDQIVDFLRIFWIFRHIVYKLEQLYLCYYPGFFKFGMSEWK